MFIGSEKMIILSKANLVDEEIDLGKIKNSIRRLSIVVGEDNGIGYLKLLKDLRQEHDKIQKVFLSIFLFLTFFNRIIQPPSPTFAKPSLTN